MGIVTAYHACERTFASALREKKVDVTEWRRSENVYDWLGDGIYFFEGSRNRAERWAREIVRGDSDVIEADIQLGLCLDLMDTEYLQLIGETYDSLVELYQQEGWELPSNHEIFGKGRSGKRQRAAARWLDRINSWLYPRLIGKSFERFRDCKLRSLDRLVINQFIDLMENGYGDQVLHFQTVRCAFEEGDAVFPGSMIREQTHIQIAVRDASSIQNIR